MKPPETVRCQLTTCRGNTARWSPVLLLSTLDGRPVRAATTLAVCDPCKHACRGPHHLFDVEEIERLARGLDDMGKGPVDPGSARLDWVDFVAREAFAGEGQSRAEKRILT